MASPSDCKRDANTPRPGLVRLEGSPLALMSGHRRRFGHGCIMQAVSRGFSELCKWPAQSLIGRSVDLLTAPGADTPLCDIAERIAPDRPWRGQSLLRSREGELIPVRVEAWCEAGYSQSGPDGMPDPLIHFCLVNIAEERSLLAENERLQRQFNQSQRIETMAQLAGGLVHDMNNIIAAITGYAALLIEDLPKDSETHGFAEHIKRAGERAHRMNGRLLSLARKQQTDAAVIDLSGLVEEGIDTVKAALPPTIRLNHTLPRTPCWLKCDPQGMLQILLNLCLNARDAIGDRPGHITLSLGTAQAPAEFDTHGEPEVSQLPDGQALLKQGRCDPHQAYAAIDVLDDGDGIDPLILSRIFEPLFTTKSVERGTGLGLAAVVGYIEALSGAVLVWTKPGEGTRFRLLLPLLEAETELSEIDADNAGDHIADSVHSQCHARIVVIDDDMLVGRMLAQSLGRLGYQVRLIQDPLEAADELIADRLDADLIITDHTMPDLTGLELIRMARDVGRTMPIILCTGYAARVDEALALEVGATAYLAKPVCLKTLRAVVADCLDGAAMERAA